MCRLNTRGFFVTADFYAPSWCFALLCGEMQGTCSYWQEGAGKEVGFSGLLDSYLSF